MGARVMVCLNGESKRLYLRGTLPAKPGKSGTSRQEIATGYTATVQGLRKAQQMAVTVTQALERETFSWGPYLRQKEEAEAPATAQAWVEKYRLTFLEKIWGHGQDALHLGQDLPSRL